MGLSLAVHNNKNFKETHDFRMEVYRRRKKLKNEALRQFLGLPEANSTPEYNEHSLQTTNPSKSDS
jgi:hypothetical protein